LLDGLIKYLEDVTEYAKKQVKEHS
jgi:hypothetical protein